MSYQIRDAHIIDYKTYQFNGYALRGPRIDTEKPYIVCLGAAQTFGPFCEEPFPELLSNLLGIQVFNLGLSGAIPAQFLNYTFYNIINNSKFAIIQVLSGRCGSNSRFKHIRNQLGIMHDNDSLVPPIVFWRYAEKKYGNELFNQLVNETRRDFLYKMIILIQSVKVPKILFYFSTREPDELPDKMTTCPFPHFLKSWMITEMAEFCDEYVECVSERGLPQKLYDKRGNPAVMKRPPWDSHLPPAPYNTYYPSPEMHEDAAKVLEPICRKVLDNLQ